MRNLLKAYVNFSRREKMGIIALLVLLMLLLLIRASMQYLVTPPDTAEQAKLVQAWEDFKATESAKQIATRNTDSVKPTEQKFSKEQKPAKQNTALFPFDPNTVDSTTLRKLGMREKTTAIFLHWRSKGKVFHKKEELKKLYTLTEEEYNRLEPYIRIN